MNPGVDIDPLINANIFSLDELQIKRVPVGCRNPYVRYATRAPIVLKADATNQIPGFVEVARFPTLGFRRMTAQFAAQYPLDPSANPGQLHYYVTAYKDTAAPKPVCGGLISPPYDQANEETDVSAKSLGLECRIVGSGANIIVLLTFSLLLEP